jgi:hypothetical protein
MTKHVSRKGTCVHGLDMQIEKKKRKKSKTFSHKMCSLCLIDIKIERVSSDNYLLKFIRMREKEKQNMSY